MATIHPNVKAFAFMLWNAEGTYNAANPALMYRTIYGGQTFADMSRHPNRAVSKWGKTSTAAGAYQFLYGTWIALQAKLRLPDFTPLSQDLAFVQKLKDRGIYDMIIAGKLETALSRASKEWSSLPGGVHARKSIAEVRGYFQTAGGNLI